MHNPKSSNLVGDASNFNELTHHKTASKPEAKYYALIPVEESFATKGVDLNYHCYHSDDAGEADLWLRPDRIFTKRKLRKLLCSS